MSELESLLENHGSLRSCGKHLDVRYQTKRSRNERHIVAQESAVRSAFTPELQIYRANESGEMTCQITFASPRKSEALWEALPKAFKKATEKELKQTVLRLGKKITLSDGNLAFTTGNAEEMGNVLAALDGLKITALDWKSNKQCSSAAISSEGIKAFVDLIGLAAQEESILSPDTSVATICKQFSDFAKAHVTLPKSSQGKIK